ncbi:MAG TPA: hypothetical protein VFM57_04500 [Thermoleophilaceae bacterium]|nr:hypothetical protein [Thermoleophilaceae bacterium]
MSGIHPAAAAGFARSAEAYERARPDYPPVTLEPLRLAPDFGPLEEHVFPNEQHLDAHGMADRIGSISFVASLPDTERAKVLKQARALAAGGPVTVPYRTEVQIAERR